MNHSCHLCGAAFKQIAKLKSHLILHEDKRVHKCEFCHKLFSKSSNLSSHIRTHTGEKPYQCKVCLRYFPRLHNVRSHLVKMHKADTSEVQQYINITTGRDGLREDTNNTNSASFRTELLESIGLCPNTSTPKCDSSDSGAVVKDTEYYTVHSGTVTLSDDHGGSEESQTKRLYYKCKTCSKTLSHKANMEDHARSHSGIKLFRCGLCNKGLSRKQNLVHHLKHVHYIDAAHVEQNIIRLNDPATGKTSARVDLDIRVNDPATGNNAAHGDLDIRMNDPSTGNNAANGELNISMKDPTTRNTNAYGELNIVEMNDTIAGKIAAPAEFNNVDITDPASRKNTLGKICTNFESKEDLLDNSIQTNCNSSKKEAGDTSLNVKCDEKVMQTCQAQTELDVNKPETFPNGNKVGCKEEMEVDSDFTISNTSVTGMNNFTERVVSKCFKTDETNMLLQGSVSLENSKTGITVEDDNDSVLKSHDPLSQKDGANFVGCQNNTQNNIGCKLKFETSSSSLESQSELLSFQGNNADCETNDAGALYNLKANENKIKLISSTLNKNDINSNDVNLNSIDSKISFDKVTACVHEANGANVNDNDVEAGNSSPNSDNNGSETEDANLKSDSFDEQDNNKMYTVLNPDNPSLKLYRCRLCGFECKRRYYMAVLHVMKHSPYKPFLCVICCKPYSRKYTLRCHLTKEHKVFGTELEEIMVTTGNQVLGGLQESNKDINKSSSVMFESSTTHDDGNITGSEHDRSYNNNLSLDDKSLLDVSNKTGDFKVFEKSDIEKEIEFCDIQNTPSLQDCDMLMGNSSSDNSIGSNNLARSADKSMTPDFKSPESEGPSVVPESPMNKPGSLPSFFTSIYNLIKNRQPKRPYQFGEQIKACMDLETMSCLKCHKRCSNKSNLKQHIKLMHINAPREFACCVCGKRFGTKFNLKMHLRQHGALLGDLGGKPRREFACTRCGKQFTTRSYLKVHVVNKHGILLQKLADQSTESNEGDSMETSIETAVTRE